MPTDVPKLWCAVAFAAAPLPPPWKQSPQGYQNTLSGAISAVHPLLRAYQRVPRNFHEEPPNAKLLHLRWMEFAPPPEAEGFADGGGGEGSAPAAAQNGAAQNGAALERRAGSPTGQRADASSPMAAEPITEAARARETSAARDFGSDARTARPAAPASNRSAQAASSGFSSLPSTLGVEASRMRVETACFIVFIVATLRHKAGRYPRYIYYSESAT
jgi:hypothetical protein